MPTAITTAAGVADSTSTYITNAQTTANTAITNLNTAAAGWAAASWTAIAKPSTGVYTLYADSDLTIKTALAAFDTALAAIAPPVLAAAPSLTGYVAPVWNDLFWTNLKGILTTFTSNITSADNVDTVVTKLTSETTKLQVALYAADRERKQQGLRDAFSAADAATGAKGFTMPNCMTNALKLAAQQNYQFDMSQVSRDLIKEMFNWAKSNYQFSIQQQVSAHNADVDFNIRYAGVLIQVFEVPFRQALDLYRATVVSQVAKFDQAVKAHTLRLDVAKTNAGISEALDRINASNFASDVQQHATDVSKAVETAATNARNRIDAAVAAVNAAANMVASANQISIGVLNG